MEVNEMGNQQLMNRMERIAEKHADLYFQLAYEEGRLLGASSTLSIMQEITKRGLNRDAVKQIIQFLDDFDAEKKDQLGCCCSPEQINEDDYFYYTCIHRGVETTKKMINTVLNPDFSVEHPELFD